MHSLPPDISEMAKSELKLLSIIAHRREFERTNTVKVMPPHYAYLSYENHTNDAQLVRLLKFRLRRLARLVQWFEGEKGLLQAASSRVRYIPATMASYLGGLAAEGLVSLRVLSEEAKSVHERSHNDFIDKLALLGIDLRKLEAAEWLLHDEVENAQTAVAGSSFNSSSSSAIDENSMDLQTGSEGEVGNIGQQEKALVLHPPGVRRPTVSGGHFRFDKGPTTTTCTVLPLGPLARRDHGHSKDGHPTLPKTVMPIRSLRL